LRSSRRARRRCGADSEENEEGAFEESGIFSGGCVGDETLRPHASSFMTH
jgi:hypothetical protein